MKQFLQLEAEFTWSESSIQMSGRDKEEEFFDIPRKSSLIWFGSCVLRVCVCVRVCVCRVVRQQTNERATNYQKVPVQLSGVSQLITLQTN